jgi:hypothetical protein
LGGALFAHNNLNTHETLALPCRESLSGTN